MLHLPRSRRRIYVHAVGSEAYAIEKQLLKYFDEDVGWETVDGVKDIPEGPNEMQRCGSVVNISSSCAIRHKCHVRDIQITCIRTV